ncbi:MAG: hypothetical protein ABI413_15550 [Ktedonobacteraceae bacterium]
MQINKSEVARLREKIDSEITAMYQGMVGYAIVSKHEVITNHYNRLDGYLTKLTAQVGEEAAIATIITELERNR